MIQAEDQTNGFMPVLIKVEVSADQINPGDVLWVTSTWQNVGTSSSPQILSGFLEIELGHQRVPETKVTGYRMSWTPYPGTYEWLPGDIWKTTCRWQINVPWGGTYRLYIGLCDEEHVPVVVCGEEGRSIRRIYIGDIDIGWMAGLPAVEKVRKEWSKEFNPSDQFLIHQQQQAECETVTIADKIRAVLDGSRSIILGLLDGQAEFRFPAMLPEIVLRERKTDRLLYSFQPELSVAYRLASSEKDRAVYRCEIQREAQSIAEFSLCYRVSGRSFILSLLDVEEQEGFELLEVRMPTLLSATGSDVNLVSFYGGGRLIPLKNSLPAGYVHHYDTRNAAALYQPWGMLVLESTCLDDRLYMSVRENQHEKRACLGVSLVNRVRGRGKIASIKVESAHDLAVEWLDKSWGEPSWQAAARFLRKGLKGKNREIYRRALFYKVLASIGPQPDPEFLRDDASPAVTALAKTTPFKEILEQFRHYYHLFDGAPQVVGIGGFQIGGFDTHYPYVLDTDKRAGKPADLRECIREAKKYNAVVGLHDNYDDTFVSEYFDPSIVAIDENGQHWKGWIWAGGQSYIISPLKYARSGKMQERVHKTIELYGLHTASHIDVLSSELLRYDFDPQNPASADQSVHGKYAIIEEYDKYGIDISSEVLVHPFVGHISFVLWTRDDRNDTLFKGEHYIPLIQMVYHGIIGYCGAGGNKVELLWGLVRASNYYAEWNLCSPEVIRWHYLQNLPLGLLYDKVMQDVVEEDRHITVKYDEASWVRVDFEQVKYEVVVDGRLIAKDYTTFVPGFRENTYLAYSLENEDFSYPAPNGWDESTRLGAVTLTAEGDGTDIACKVENDRVRMKIPLGIPVRVTKL